MPITLVLADDHPLMLDGLESLFRVERDFMVVARCINGDEAVRAVRKHRPDVLVLDIKMPRMDGLTALREMQRQGLSTTVVILAAAIGDAEVVEALRLGVRGVVLKEQAPQELVKCVRTVHAGGQWIEPSASYRALDTLLRRESVTRSVAETLTPRESELIELVAGGLRNKEIADRLSISEGTVKIHLNNIYKKLHVGSRVELALWARSHGLA